MGARTRRLGLAGFMKKAFLLALLPILMLVINAPDATNAQVATNITPTQAAPLDLGTDVNTVETITEITGGTRPNNGTNLFHSFDFFTLGTGDSAHFMNNMELPTTNIISRVIGTEPSTIDGTLRTNNPADVNDPMNFGAANLWLVNPSGLLLGPNVRIEVGGSVSMSTANYLRFESTPALFDMLSSPASLGPLDVAPVVAFGFVGSNPGAITVQGSQFSVTEGQNISLVGGKVIIQSGTPDGGTTQPAQLSAPNGKILLASAASTGEFDAATLQPLPTVDGTSFTSFGSVSLAAGSHIDVSGASTVFIKGGQIVLSVNDAVLTTSQTPSEPETILLSSGSSIVTSTSGTDPGADVQLTAGTLQMDGTLVQTLNSGDGTGGNISINATTVGLTNGASILSFTGLDFTTGEIVGSGTGGNVTVQGLGGAGSPADSVVSNGSAMATSTFGPGRGGNMELIAGTLTMENSSALQTVALGGGGAGGDLILDVGTASLLGGVVILTSTQNFTPGGGQGGNVIIQGLQGVGSAAESVRLSGGSSLSTQTFGSSDGGRVAITSKSLTMDEFATINASTNEVGQGGDVVVSVLQASLSGGAIITTQTSSAQAGPTLTVQGLQGAGSMADSVVVSGLGSGIVSDSFGTGRAGDIAVQAKTVTLADEAVIQAGTLATSAAGGNVTIEANSVNISGGSSVSSQASHLDAGLITIRANTLNLDNGSIATNTASEGRAGDVVVNVGTTVSLSNGAEVNSSTSGAGRAGDITMNVGTLTITDGSRISSASIGTDAITNSDDGTIRVPGTAGNVAIAAAGSFTSDGSTVATSAEANHGGDVSITAHSVQLSNGTLITANSNGPLEVKETVLIDGLPVEQVVGNGNAGNITVRSGSTFVMQNSSMTTEATQASGGQIEIITPEMVRVVNGRVSTSVAGFEKDTAGGNITIDPQFVVLQGGQIEAKAFAGDGGAIDIVATSAFIKDPASSVNASSTLGISGTINIQSPLQNIGGELAPLSDEFSSAAALLAQQCAARAAGGKFSTFVVAAREGLPAEPGGFLASPSLTAESLGSRLSGRDSQPEFSTVTGAFPEYEARPIQLAKLGNACHSVK